MEAVSAGWDWCVVELVDDVAECACGGVSGLVSVGV